MYIPTSILAILAAANTANAAFTSLALRSASPVHYQPLQARNGGIWVGGNDATYCPGAQVPTCGDFKNLTAFQVDDGRASMATAVPGGQQLYVGPKGSLRYTVAHSGAIPAGAYTSGFRRYPGSASNGINFWTFDGAGGASGFFACPQGKDENGDVAYKLYADVEGFVKTDCLGFTATRESFGGPAAWQYA